jgi:TonB family protein
VAFGSFEVVRAASRPAAAVPWSSIAWGVLGLVVSVRTMWLLIGMVRLRRLRRAAVSVDVAEFFEVQQSLATFADIRYTPDLAQPVTFGLRRPVVLLPASLADAADTLRRAVTTHELLHVQRRDWGWVLLEEALRTVFWFNPATWWLTSRIQQAREEVVDHLTVLAIGSRRDYIEALLAFADASAPAPVPAFARRAHLFTRIMRISKESSTSSVRVLLSGLAMLVVVAGVGVYAQTTFPVRAAVAVGAPQTAADAAVKPVTLENPIPRRVFAVPIQHPDAHDDLVAVTQLLVRLDAFGHPTVVRSLASGVSLARGAAARQQPSPPVPAGAPPAFDAFYQAAADAITQWRYEPPADAPIEFVVVVRFNPGQAASVSQTERSSPVFAGPDGVRLVTDVELDRDRTTLARANAAANGSSPVRIGGQIKTPIKTRDVRPVYPAIAQTARVQGVVIVEVTIDEQGRVSDARVLRSIPLLDIAAVEAVRQWEFTPTLLNGAPVSVIMTTTIQFMLPPQ